MKKIFLIITILFSINGIAQDSQLFDNSWYLQNIIISGADNFAPSNVEVSNVPLSFTNNVTYGDYSTTVCETLGGTLMFDGIAPYFTFTEFNITLGSGCTIVENSNFESTYFYGFFDTNQNNPFEYNIITNPDNSKTLTITSINGDQAIYGSSTLSVNKKKFLDIEITSNPVVDVISIKNKSNLNKIKAEIFDLKGQLKLKYLLTNEDYSTLNIEKLTSGIYFVLFETEDGRTLTKKILKK